jgi:hypothetical protein
MDERPKPFVLARRQRLPQFAGRYSTADQLSLTDGRSSVPVITEAELTKTTKAHPGSED